MSSPQSISGSSPPRVATLPAVSSAGQFPSVTSTQSGKAAISLTNKGSATQTVDGGGMLTVKGGLVKIN